MELCLSDVISIGSSLLVGGGVVVGWVRFGRKQAARDEAWKVEQTAKDEALQVSQQAIVKRLDDPDTGLAALNKKVGEQNLHCANTVGRFDERLLTTEREIRDIKASGKAAGP